MSVFTHDNIETATPALGFALPPYTVQENPQSPDKWCGVQNVNGFNCLTFTDKPGAVMTSTSTARIICDRWNSR